MAAQFDSHDALPADPFLVEGQETLLSHEQELFAKLRKRLSLVTAMGGDAPYHFSYYVGEAGKRLVQMACFTTHILPGTYGQRIIVNQPAENGPSSGIQVDDYVINVESNRFGHSSTIAQVDSYEPPIFSPPILAYSLNALVPEPVEITQGRHYQLPRAAETVNERQMVSRVLALNSLHISLMEIGTYGNLQHYAKGPISL